MKFQSMHHSKVNPQTDSQAQSNMPLQLFQSWGHKNNGLGQLYLELSTAFRAVLTICHSGMT